MCELDEPMNRIASMLIIFSSLATLGYVLKFFRIYFFDIHNYGVILYRHAHCPF